MNELNFSMVSEPDFNQLMAEVAERLSDIAPGTSLYCTLVELTEILREASDKLAELMKVPPADNAGAGFACKRGCSTCCLIPSNVRPRDKRNFSMSILDLVMLVENYSAIASQNPSLHDDAVAAVAQARRTGEMVACPNLGASGECQIYEFRPVACKIWFSKDLQSCIDNRSKGYKRGINHWTDSSRDFAWALERPFMEFIERIAPDIRVSEYDFLQIFEDIAKLENANLLREFGERVDQGKLYSWDPFGSPAADTMKTAG